MKNWIYLLPFVFLWMSCSEETEKPKGEIFAIRSVGTLSTSEYTVGKVIRLNDVGEWYKLGDRKILISCKAKIKAGVNLNNIQENDIVVEGKKITIYLPETEIISFEMDPNSIKTEMVDVTGFRFDFSQEEQNDILGQGEAAIRKDMKKLNILNDAERNAIVFVQDFYKELGYEEVIVHGKKQTKRTTDTRR